MELARASKECAIRCTGGGEDPVVVGGWGTAAAARARTWVAGAGETAIEKNRPLLETIRDAPTESAQGVLEECEGYRALRAVVRVLRRAVAQRRAGIPHMAGNLRRPAGAEPFGACPREAVARLVAELGGAECGRLPEPPAQVAAAARALALTRRTGRATAAQLRADVAAAVEAAGVWADAVELYYGDLACAVDRILTR
jgi:hypothetical protein